MNTQNAKFKLFQCETVWYTINFFFVLIYTLPSTLHQKRNHSHSLVREREKYKKTAKIPRSPLCWDTSHLGTPTQYGFTHSRASRDLPCCLTTSSVAQSLPVSSCYSYVTPHPTLPWPAGGLSHSPVSPEDPKCPSNIPSFRASKNQDGTLLLHYQLQCCDT